MTFLSGFLLGFGSAIGLLLIAICVICAKADRSGVLQDLKHLAYKDNS
jgi:hypothetical protein